MQKVKGDKVITGEGFDRLLALLGTDMDGAAQKYEEIRLKLTGFFQGKGCAHPEELVDTTMDRVAKLVTQGEEIRVSDPFRFFRGIARNIFLEYTRNVKTVPIEVLPPGKIPGIDPREIEKENEDQSKRERKDLCMKQCFERLDAEKRVLIVEYEKGEKSERIKNRKKIAGRLGTTVNALSIRIFKIRTELKACLAACLNSQVGENIV